MKDIFVKPVLSVVIGYATALFLMNHFVLIHFGELPANYPGLFSAMNFMLYMSLTIGFVHLVDKKWSKLAKSLLFPLFLIGFSALEGNVWSKGGHELDGVLAVLFLSVVYSITVIFLIRTFSLPKNKVDKKIVMKRGQTETNPQKPVEVTVLSLSDFLKEEEHHSLQDMLIYLEDKISRTKKLFEHHLEISHNLERMERQLVKSIDSFLRIRHNKQAEYTLKEIFISANYELEEYLQMNDFYEFNNLEKIKLERMI